MADCSCIRCCCYLSELKYETRSNPLKRLKRSNRELKRLLKDLDYLVDITPKSKNRFYIIQENISSDESCSCSESDCSSCEELNKLHGSDCDCFKSGGNSLIKKDPVYEKNQTEKLIDKYRTNTEIAKDDLNKIWSTLTSNLGNYLDIKKSIEISKNFDEKDKKCAAEFEKTAEIRASEEALAEVTSIKEPLIDNELIDKNDETKTAEDKQLPTKEQIEFYLSQIHLYYENKNLKSSEVLDNLAKIKNELDVLHKFLRSNDVI